jgi:hypothetical protein
VLTIAPELRRFLATWHHHRKRLALDRTAPLFPGDTPGRLRPATIQRRLARLDAPASLWHNPPDTTIGEDAHADGRALLLRLSAWHLWLAHDETAA